MTWRYLDDMVIGYTPQGVCGFYSILLLDSATDHDQHHHHLMKGL